MKSLDGFMIRKSLRRRMTRTRKILIS